jgi:hypothetical protein
MGIEEALEQLEEIHHHVSRSEVYKGYRSVLTALMGLIAFLAAFLQPHFVKAEQPLSFVYFWVAAAALNASLAATPILYHFIRFESRSERQKTLKAVGQFIPCVLAGAVLTFSMCKASEAFVPFMPALWSILFGMGVHASKPYLPSAIHWMAVFFFGGGLYLLTLAPQGLSLSPWAMGLDFGVGMLLGAAILYFNIERKRS